jgi:ElaA protein
MIKYQTKPFNELTVYELYEIGRLRQEVFVLEQNCPYVDFDGKDIFCQHLMGMDEENKLQSYARLVPKGISYPGEISIGRVLTSCNIRNKGEGRSLMLHAIETCFSIWGRGNIRISAQTYLLNFYESIGFKSTGKTYLEDDIPHTEMLAIF